MMTCAEAARQLSDRMDRKPVLRRLLGLRMHLLMCSGCRHYASQLQLMRNWLRSKRLEGVVDELADDARLDQAAQGKILSAIQAKNL